MKTVACVGILVADVIVEKVFRYPGKGVLEPVNSITMHNGGNAMTAAINLRKFGVQSHMVGMVGDDMFGQFLASKLKDASVDTAGLRVSDRAQTSTSVLMIDDAGERSFFHCTGTNAVFSYDDIDFSVVDKCDLVFVTGTYLMDSFDGEGTARFLRECKERGKTTFLDVCWDARSRWGELLEPCMPYIDYLMPSIDEAKRIAGKDEPEEIADALLAKGVKNVVIKLGRDGSYLKKSTDEKGRIFSPFRIEKSVDSTGAGDTFCSGFIAAYARGMTPEECMPIANASGALCVTEKGATAGTKSFEHTLEFIKEYEKGKVK